MSATGRTYSSVPLAIAPTPTSLANVTDLSRQYLRAAISVRTAATVAERQADEAVVIARPLTTLVVARMTREPDVFSTSI